MSRDFTKIAKGYARAVLTGKVPACQQIHRACERFEADLNSKRWVYDRAKAHRACTIIELLPHTEGELAGELISLEPWQVFLVVNLFGIVDKNGLRKYREAFLMLPRKMGKSTLAAAIAIVMTFFDGEDGAQTYIGANSEKQANFCFVPVKRMVARSGLGPQVGVEVLAKSVVSEATGSFIERMIGKPGDGGNPHCAILDEAHENDGSEQYDTMKTGMGARRQPLLITITTAGTNTAGPCKLLQSYAEGVLNGVISDDRFFALIYTIDPKDDWRDIRVWRKSNPNYGVSVSEEFLQKMLEEALARPDKAGIAKTKHLNIWESSKASWANMADWAKAADPTLDIMKLKGRPATLGLDLATVSDFSGVLARVELEDGREAYFPFLFLPERAVERSKNAGSYAQWRDEGEAIITEGDATDFAHVEEKARWLCEHLNVQAIGYDGWQGEMMAQRLQSSCRNVSKIMMNAKTFSPPMKAFEAELATGKVTHPGNRAFTWMVGNVVASADRFENIMPDKPRGQDHLKIDGIVAALMAKAVAMSAEDKPTKPAPLFAMWSV